MTIQEKYDLFTELVVVADRVGWRGLLKHVQDERERYAGILVRRQEKQRRRE